MGTATPGDPVTSGDRAIRFPAVSDVRTPITVAAVNDYELVVEGVAALLRRYPDRLIVADRIIVGEPLSGPVDVALYDTYGRVGVAAKALRTLVDDPLVGRVAVFSLDLRPELVEEARAAGARGFISKALEGTEIADALVRLAGGEEVEAIGSAQGEVPSELDWPGKSAELSERESQVLVLCAEGLTNKEIGDALYIGSETVKTHLTRVFRKLDLRNRVQAAAYVRSEHGFSRHR